MAADFTLTEFLAWVRTKPADEVYCFTVAADCALGQFAREMHGYTKVEAACEVYRPRVSADLFDAALGRFERWPDNSEKTFGALAARLQSLLPAETNWLTPETYLAADCGEYVA